MNDVYDYPSDMLNPRKASPSLQGSVLPPPHHPPVRRAAQLSTALILLTALLTNRNAQNTLATALLVLLGWQYSAPPLRLKEVPLLDSLSNGLIVFLAWYVGYSFGRGAGSALRKGCVLALCTAGVHALGAVIDVDVDAAAGQTTIATFWGARPAAMLGVLAYAVALFLEGSTSVFGVYLWGGFVVMVVPCLRVQLANYAFEAIVYWTVGMSMVWFGSKAFVAGAY